MSFLWALWQIKDGQKLSNLSPAENIVHPTLRCGWALWPVGPTEDGERDMVYHSREVTKALQLLLRCLRKCALRILRRRRRSPCMLWAEAALHPVRSASLKERFLRMRCHLAREKGQGAPRARCMREKGLRAVALPDLVAPQLKPHRAEMDHPGKMVPGSAFPELWRK